MTPAPVVVPDLWRLGAQPSRLGRAAAAWRDLAAATGAAREDAGRSAGALLAHWRGPTAQAYAAHRDAQDRGLAALSTVAGQVADLVDEGAGVLSAAQGHLDDSWHRVRRAVDASARGDEVVFRPADEVDAGLVAAAVAEAQQIRSDTDRRLGLLASRIDRVRSDVWVGSIVAYLTEETPNPIGLTPWLAGPDAPGTTGLVILDGSRAIVSGGPGADDIRVAVDPLTQERLVTVAGIVRRLPPGTEVVIHAGGGDDTVTVAPGTRIRLTVLGGAGDDSLRGGDGGDNLLGLWGADTIVAGSGADRVSAGPGRDYVDGRAGDDVLSGGAGADTLYGLEGADALCGGDDQDYLDGGTGGDLVHGAGGPDALIGGRGADTLLGGEAGDRLYGGPGTDRIAGSGGDDRAFAQPEDAVVAAENTVTVRLREVPGAIRIEGTAEFVARVSSDVDALGSSPAGVAMLDGIERGAAARDAPHLPFVDRTGTVTIRESAGYGETRVRGIGGDRHPTIGYNHRFDDFWYSPPVPPVVVLYHELAHAYDHLNATMAGGVYTGADNPEVPNAERVATGLPIDDDGDPGTPDQLDPRHPYELTENGLRAELNLSARTRY